MIRRAFLLSSASMAVTSYASAQAFLGGNQGSSPPTSIQLVGNSIVDNAAAGTVVGTFFTTGGVPPDTYSGWTNSKFQISGSNLVRSATGTLTAGTPETGNVTSTDSQGSSTNTATNGQGPFSISVTAHTGQVTSFNLVNSVAAASKCRYRRALWFKKGDVPTGSIPVIGGGVTPTYQFDERNFWSDGSLKLCVLSMIDTDFTGGINETRTYTITTTTGSYSNTGLRTLADITGAHTFQVKFSNTQQFDGTSATTRGSGAFTADFNTHAAVATRVFNYHSGAVCSSWEIWGMATDDTGGAADPHLKTIWYVTAWNNPNGTLYDIEYAAVVAQDWWRPAATKYQLRYTATLKDASATINTYSTIQHPYHSQWMTAQTGNNDNHGRRFWAGTTPTLFHTFDKNYARSTGLFPYLDPTFVPNSNATDGYTSNYTPCSAQNHRAFIDDTGGYIGRGLMPQTDCIAWMRQTSNDYRYARTNGFAGLHVPYHYRSNDSRTISSGPQAGTDTANTVISMIMRPLSAPTYDFTAQGMPAAIDAYVQGAAAPVAATFVSILPTGHTQGVWTTSIDSSHAVAYSYGMYMLEGERHFMQATLDLGTNCSHQLSGTTISGAPQASYYATPPFSTYITIPNTQYSGITKQWPQSGNERDSGWSMLLAAHTDIVCPDADVQAGFIQLFRQQQAAFVVFNMTYMEPNQLSIGVYSRLPGSSHFISGPWMGNFQTMAHAVNVLANEDSNSLSALNTCMQYNTVAPWEGATPQPYRGQIYRQMTLLKSQTTYDRVTNPFLARSALLCQVDTICTSNVLNVRPNNPLIPGIVNGDIVYFLASSSGGAVIPIPTGFTEAVAYYATNVVGSGGQTTMQVEASPGSGALPIPNGTYSTGFQSANWTTTPAVNPPYIPIADDYIPINVTALIMAQKAGANAITTTHTSAAIAFLASVNWASWVTWKLTP